MRRSECRSHKDAESYGVRYVRCCHIDNDWLLEQRQFNPTLRSDYGELIRYAGTLIDGRTNFYTLAESWEEAESQLLVGELFPNARARFLRLLEAR